jgi:hypothetical protein
VLEVVNGPVPAGVREECVRPQLRVTEPTSLRGADAIVQLIRHVEAADTDGERVSWLGAGTGSERAAIVGAPGDEGPGRKGEAETVPPPEMAVTPCRYLAGGELGGHDLTALAHTAAGMGLLVWVPLPRRPAPWLSPQAITWPATRARLKERPPEMAVSPFQWPRTPTGVV